MYFHKFTMLTLVLAGACSSVMAADGPPKEVKSEFHQNVFKRDRLVRELATLDSKAADAVAAGQKPIDMHSHQVEMQDQIDRQPRCPPHALCRAEPSLQVLR